MGPLAWGAVIVGGLYTAICGLVAASEPALLFPAPEVSRESLEIQRQDLGASLVELETPDQETLYGWRVGEGDVLLVHFSGNGSTVARTYEPLYRKFNDAGWEVLHVNYRGYPGSTGKPTEKGLLVDAHTVWQEATRTHQPENIVVWGTSLGGGVSVGLVSDPAVEPRALVLESTFVSAAKAGQDAFPFLPVKLLMRNDFNSGKRAPAIETPTVVVHGKQDRVVKVEQGRRLAEMLPNATYVELPSVGHNAGVAFDAEVWNTVLETVAEAKP